MLGGKAHGGEGTAKLCLGCDTFEIPSRYSRGANGYTESELRGDSRAGVCI